MTFKVMVSYNGVNEEGKVVTGLHTYEVATEEEIEEWVAKAPALKRNIDDGPPIRVEIPSPGRGRRKE